MFAAAQVGSALPSFSYQAIVPELYNAATISISPSSSISFATISCKPELSPVNAISAATHEGSAAPSFSYHVIGFGTSSSPRAPETISRSPSPSMSATCTVIGVCTENSSATVHEGSVAPSFSYQIILPRVSGQAAIAGATTSISPSPSISATNTSDDLS